jgi:hypothetical protein
MAVKLAVLEARLDFHRGMPTQPEKAVMAAAEASALEAQAPNETKGGK